MKDKKFQLSKDRLRRVLFFIHDGLEDYAASRLLLLNNMPKQGAILSSTAIEKVFKAILAVNGNESHGHLKKAHWNKVKNFDQAAFELINMNFLKLNRKVYKMRYSDSLPHDFNIVIASREFLAELDHTFINYVSRLHFDDKSVFDSMLNANDPRLNTENHVVLQIDKESFIYSKPQLIYEFRMTPNKRPYEMNYCSDKPAKNNSFLRGGFNLSFDEDNNLNTDMAFYPTPNTVRITLSNL